MMGDADPARYSRRGVSVRWLFGAVVTAITSTALMGGALIAALDGRYVVSAHAAPLVDAAKPRAVRKGEKGDRVRPAYEAVSSRRVIEIATVVRQGDERIIAKRPYVMVNASLVLDRADIAGDIPAFNARELVSTETQAGENATDAISAQEVDGEITVSVSDFPLDEGVTFQDDLELKERDIARQIRGEAPQPVDGLPTVVASADGSVNLADDAAFVDPAQETAPNLLVIPENVSELVKTEDDDDEGDDNELLELVQPGDTLSKILVGSGVSAGDVKEINAVLTEMKVAKLMPGQTLRIGFALDEEGEEAQRRPTRLSIYEKDRHIATVAMTDSGEFVLGEAPAGPAPDVSALQVAAPRNQTPPIYDSLYQTATDNELPDRVRDILVATFANEVDYNASVRAGDTLTVLHSQPVEGASEATELLFAALTVGGVQKRFYRFKSEDGTVDYYDEDGRTGDRFLMRKPVQRGVYRSGFGMRSHPILRRRRMHKGVDYAAPRGTPIYAAGDGVVSEAGWKAGYGRWVSIKHLNGYMTGYAHQSQIAKGIKPGVRVKQGQVIGYVGSTGFSTGPHLHYEVHVNGRPVNPLKIRLRRGKELTGSQLASFRAERDRIDTLLDERRIELARR
ncbi:peptidase, M23/M37 family protein [Stappia sp. 22II-S9-Z10]|nr:peptidase, M23/M37 family protein [Stappia sp. 22II-S9-Z10]